MLLGSIDSGWACILILLLNFLVEHVTNKTDNSEGRKDYLGETIGSKQTGLFPQPSFHILAPYGRGTNDIRPFSICFRRESQDLCLFRRASLGYCNCSWEN